MNKSRRNKTATTPLIRFTTHSFEQMYNLHMYTNKTNVVFKGIEKRKEESNLAGPIRTQVYYLI
jgi:hypothetical protein